MRPLTLRLPRRLSSIGSNLSRRELILAMAAASFLWGGGDGHPPFAQGAVHKPKPWFDAKGAFVFPLADGPLPGSREALVQSLTDGWKAHLRFPEGGDLVQTDGGRYPALGTLHVHLGGGIMPTHRDDEKDPPLKPSGKVESRVSIRDFDLDAAPLICDKAKINMHVSATDARMDIQRDEKGRPLLMMGDARAANFSFDATNEDMERLLKIDLNEAGQKYGVSVSKVQLKLTSINSRSIDVDVHISTRVAMIPAGMRFTAHVDIDNDMYAKLSNLKCEGDEALGPLISGLIRPGLAKYEGKRRLMFSFPTGDLKLRDVQIQGGDEVKLSASFAR